MSTGLIPKRSLLASARGVVSFLAVRPGYATNNCYFVQLECTSSLNANNNGVLGGAKGVKEAGGSGEWRGYKQVSAQIIHILYIHISVLYFKYSSLLFYSTR